MSFRIFSGIALVALAVSATAAQSADLGTRAYTKAPMAPAPISVWSGCYIGGNVGGGWDRQDYTNVNPHRLPNFDLGSERNSGVLGGGQVGCDYQVGSWVIGAQGMFEAADLRGSNHVVPGAADPQFPNVFDLSAKTSWITTATMRVGYAVLPQALIYVKGGAAWTHAKLDYTITGMGVSNNSGAETRSGWDIGGGLEYLFAPNWSVFVEYNHMDFGTQTLNTQDAFGFIEPIRVSRRIDTVMAGVNFRFGPWGR
ncbi:outer membrane immunogenic protein [Bradyrhizobium sp. S3.3.6]|uniref:outer membrane protein n=1 Tax=Bradyrhizobium sp. S3.3.6 TaxID=3156429 RepID=UPI0033935737